MMAMNIKIKVPHFFKSVRYSLAAVNGVFLLLRVFASPVTNLSYQVGTRFPDTVDFLLCLATGCLLGIDGYYKIVTWLIHLQQGGFSYPIHLWMQSIHVGSGAQDQTVIWITIVFIILPLTRDLLLAGLLLLFAGIAVMVAYTEYEELITNRFFTVAGFVIATGVIIILGSGLGVYAAISQEFYFVAGYVVLLLIILVFEISIMIACYTLSNDAESEIRTTMVQSLQLYGSRLEVTKIWDDLQMGFQCCGVAGRFDWISNQIPVSCCHIDYGTISPFECDTANAYSDGCATMLGAYLAYQANVMAICLVVATCWQVPLTLFGGYAAWRSKFEEVELES